MSYLYVHGIFQPALFEVLILYFRGPIKSLHLSHLEEFHMRSLNLFLFFQRCHAEGNYGFERKSCVASYSFSFLIEFIATEQEYFLQTFFQIQIFIPQYTLLICCCSQWTNLNKKTQAQFFLFGRKIFEKPV